MGKEAFVEWAMEKFIGKDKIWAIPPVKEIQRYGHKDKVLKVIKKETGNDLGELWQEKGSYRRIAMDIL